tara:strand:+ start:782 stop:1054 length:273 start_codon:yes stop_codon:yes gene_type:complete
MEYDIDKWDYEDYDDSTLNNKNKRDVEMAREYCDKHEFYYGCHTCEPTWRKDGELDMYAITLHENQKLKEAFVKGRNKKVRHRPKKFKKK